MARQFKEDQVGLKFMVAKLDGAASVFNDATTNLLNSIGTEEFDLKWVKMYHSMVKLFTTFALAIDRQDGSHVDLTWMETRRNSKIWIKENNKLCVQLMIHRSELCPIPNNQLDGLADYFGDLMGVLDAQDCTIDFKRLDRMKNDSQWHFSVFNTLNDLYRQIN